MNKFNGIRSTVMELYKITYPLNDYIKENVIDSLNRYIQANDIDQEIIPYLNRINSIPGCVTMHSCIGHNKYKYDTGYLVVWFDHDITSSFADFVYHNKYITIPIDLYEKLEEEGYDVIQYVNITIGLFNNYCVGFYAIKGTIVDYIDYIIEKIKEF